MNRHETNSVTSADIGGEAVLSQAPADLHPSQTLLPGPPSWQAAFSRLPLSHLPTEGKDETL